MNLFHCLLVVGIISILRVDALRNFTDALLSGSRTLDVRPEVCYFDTATFATVRHLVTSALTNYFPSDAAQIVSTKLGRMYGDCWSVVIGRDYNYYVYWMEHDYCFYFDCEWWQAVLVAKQKCPGEKTSSSGDTRKKRSISSAFSVHGQG